MASIDRFTFGLPDSNSVQTNIYGYFTNYVANAILPGLSDPYVSESSSIPLYKAHVATCSDEVVIPALVACVCIAIDLELARNMLCEITASKSGPVGKVIAECIARKDTQIPRKHLEQLITEIFVVRDAVAHGHRHIVTTKYDDNFKSTNTSTKRPKNTTVLFGDKKYRERVNLRNKQTKIARLHVVLEHISFIDVYKMLLVAEIVFSLINTNFRSKAAFSYENRYVSATPVNGMERFSLRHTLRAYYLECERHPHFKKEVRKLLNVLKHKYERFTIFGLDCVEQ